MLHQARASGIAARARCAPRVQRAASLNSLARKPVQCDAHSLATEPVPSPGWAVGDQARRLAEALLALPLDPCERCPSCNGARAALLHRFGRPTIPSANRVDVRWSESLVRALSRTIVLRAVAGDPTPSSPMTSGAVAFRAAAGTMLCNQRTRPSVTTHRHPRCRLQGRQGERRQPTAL